MAELPLNCAEGRHAYLAHDWCHSCKTPIQSDFDSPSRDALARQEMVTNGTQVTSHQAAAESGPGKRVRQNSMVEKDSAALNELCL